MPTPPRRTAMPPSATSVDPALKVTGALSETPLAKLHTRARSRTRRAISWSTFRAADYSAEARAWTVRFYRSLAAGEYLSVGLFARIADSLAEQGAPFDLIAEAARIPSDEIRHAEHALSMASACAGRPVTLDVDRAKMRDPRTRPATLGELDLLLLDVAAIGETLAVAVLGEAARSATDPVARSVLRGFVADELHHARIGWYYASWRAPRWTVADRQRVANRVAEVALDTDRRFARQLVLPSRLRQEAAKLGVIDGRLQRAIVARTMREEVVPGLDALGLGTSSVCARRE